MSCYIVSDNHINYLANAVNHLLKPEHIMYHGEGVDPYQSSAIGQLLLDSNVDSYNARYPREQVNKSDYRYKFRLCRDCLPINPVQLIKAIQCYQYQSCEHSGWETSKAKEITDSLLRSALRHLPGYNDAKWSID